MDPDLYNMEPSELKLLKIDRMFSLGTIFRPRWLRQYASSARFAVSSSNNSCARSAAVEAASAVAKRLEGAPPSLVILFANAAHYGIEVGQQASVSGKGNPADPFLMSCLCMLPFRPCSMPPHAVGQGGPSCGLRGEAHTYWMRPQGDKIIRMLIKQYLLHATLEKEVTEAALVLA